MPPYTQHHETGLWQDREQEFVVGTQSSLCTNLWGYSRVNFLLLVILEIAFFFLGRNEKSIAGEIVQRAEAQALHAGAQGMIPNSTRSLKHN